MAESVDLGLVRTLVEVHRAGSITGAAVRLGVSQPAVTAQVKSLERILGRALFVRHARGVAPTPFAEMIATEAAPHIDALQHLVGATCGEHDPLAGQTIAIGGPAELISTCVVSALAPLVARGLRVRVVLGLPDDLLGGLTSGHLDLVISTVKVKQRGVYIAPFCEEELLLIASAARAAELVPRLHEGPADEVLAGESLIAYSEEMPLIRRYWSLVFNVRPRSRPAIVVPDLRGVLAAVVAGIGISVVPDYLCQSAIDCGEVRQILTPEQTPTNTLVLVVRAGGLSQRHLAAVHSHLVEHGRLWGSVPDTAESRGNG